MFEKESEEYTKHWIVDEDSNALMQEAFQDGAEFGYNKAKEELEEKYKETFCNLEMNLNSVTERLEELKKVNEWHYLKDGVFPKEGETVYCFCRGYCGASFCATARLYIGYDDKVKRWWTNAGEGKSEQLIDVIAWKEAVLPELKETDK